MKYMKIIIQMFIILFFVSPAFAESVDNRSLNGDFLKHGEISISPLNSEFIEYQNQMKNYEMGDVHSVNSVRDVDIKNIDFKNGLVPSPIDMSHIDKTYHTANEDINLLSSSALPSYYDLRNDGRVTSIKDQGNGGNCWAFASYASLESCIISDGIYDFSENHMKNLMSNSYSNGFDIETNYGGNSLMSAAYLTRWDGPIDELDDPYNEGSTFSDDNLIERKHIQNIIFLPNRDYEQTHNDDFLKSVVMEYGAVYTGMLINWDGFNDDYSTYYYDSYNNDEFGHAVAIVGWDDNFDKNYFDNVPDGNGAFIIKNSWGAGYGENGYFYISYYDLNFASDGGSTVFMSADNIDNYDNIYQYDPLGYVDAYGYGKNSVWCANVFTAHSNEYLKAVSFYTTDEDTRYELYVYNNVDNPPVDSNAPVYFTEGIFEYAGYHTVDINNPITLKSNQDYSIVIKFIDPDYSYLVAAEIPYEYYSSNAFSNSGESYISSDGKNWEDLVDDDSNVCIKAFTNTPCPEAVIDSIISEPLLDGDVITFTGYGNDPDGIIVAYEWTSDIDGKLSTDAVFNTNNLSLGPHTIYFKVKDDADVWSDEISLSIIVSDTVCPIINMNASSKELISINQPIVLTVNSTDIYPYYTNLVINDCNDIEIINESLTSHVMNGVNYEYVWNAINSSGKPVLSGKYNIILNSVDTSGNIANTNIYVIVDNDKPIVDIKNMIGTGLSNDDVYTNSTLKINASASGTPGDAESVTFTLSSQTHGIENSKNAEFFNGNWTAVFDMSSFENDGEYKINAFVKDAANNTNLTNVCKTVILDRDVPILHSAISRFNDTHGIINITSNEELSKCPTVKMNGKIINVDPCDIGWYGTYLLEDSKYIYSISGIDLAGNCVYGNFTKYMETIETCNCMSTWISEYTNTIITFHTITDIKDTVVITESNTPMASINKSLLGFYYIDIDPGKLLNASLSYVTISIPINETYLPPGIMIENVSIRYYNSSIGNWEILDTSVIEIGGNDYWVTQVDHLSIFGAIANDYIVPKLESVTPAKNTSFAHDTELVKIKFNYNDKQTGINPISTKFYFNGDNVTKSEYLELTDCCACYSATNLNAGIYTASVIVYDYANNFAIFNTSFSIADHISNSGSSGSSGSSSGGSGGGGSPEPQSNVETKELSQQFIANGMHVEFEFPYEVTCVEYVGFDAKKSLGGTSTVVEMLKNKSTLVSELPIGDVYKNLNIWVGNGGIATPENVENGVIGFKIENSWINENVQGLEYISMWYYDGMVWNELDTNITNKDEIYTYFESDVTGFSHFLIIANYVMESTELEINEHELISSNDISNASLDTQSKIEKGTSNEKTENVNGFGFIFTFGIIAILCSVFKKTNI